MTCHFVDDRVMPGTLMYECCLHTLRIFLMRMGWIGEAGEVACQPVPGRVQPVEVPRAGDRVDPEKVTYEVEIKELGYRPRALRDRRCLDVRRRPADRRDHGYVVADDRGSIGRNDRAGSGTGRLGIRGRPSTIGPESWRSRSASRRRRSANLTGSSTTGGRSRGCQVRSVPVFGPGRRGRRRALGDDGRIDGGGRVRRPARRLVLRGRPPGGRCRSPSCWKRPLQPCGWLAAYMGSALTSDDRPVVPEPRRLGRPARRGRPRRRHA